MNPTLKDTAIILKEIFKTHSSITTTFLNRDDNPLNSREHNNNIEILVSKKVIFFINKSYIPNSDELDFFIENGITLSEKEEQDHIQREKINLDLAVKANKKANISNLIAFLALLVAIFALIKDFKS